MGHDITSYKGANDEGESVAYMHRGAFNPLNSTIYDALDAQECNGGVSGYGVSRTFTAEELRNALAEIPEGDDFDVEREFLVRTLAGCDGAPATIFFG